MEKTTIKSITANYSINDNLKRLAIDMSSDFVNSIISLKLSSIDENNDKIIEDPIYDSQYFCDVLESGNYDYSKYNTTLDEAYVTIQDLFYDLVTYRLAIAGYKVIK